MPEVYLKALKYSSLKDLNNELSNMQKLITTTPAKMLLASAQKLPATAEDYLKKGDQEQAYILFMRFTHLAMEIGRSPDIKREDTKSVFSNTSIKRCLEQAEALTKILERRYKTAEEEKLLRNAAIEAVKAPPEVTVAPSNNFAGAASNKAKDYTDELTCIELNELVNRFRGTGGLLIMDVRPQADFQESHIDVPCIISVPKEIVKPGITTTKLEGQLPAESRNLWKTRIGAKYVVLVDWNSTLKGMLPMSEIYYLKTILLKWDIGVRYERTPLVLHKGYSEWLDMYPSITTNPRVEAKHSPEDLDDLICLDSIDYPDLLSQSSPSNPSPLFNRSLKPAPIPVVKEAFVQPIKPEIVSEILPAATTQPSIPVFDRTLKQQLVDKIQKQKDVVLNEAVDKQKELLEVEKKWEKFRQAKENEANDELRKMVEQEYLDEIARLQEQCKKLDLENNELKTRIKTESETPGVKVPPEVDAKDEELGKLKAVTTQMAKKRILQSEKIPRIPPPPSKFVEKSKPTDSSERTNKPPRFEPLKREPSESSNLSRSHSSPNIKDMDDDMPQFDRRTKPAPHREHFLPRVEKRDLSPVYGTKGPGLTGLKNLGNSCYMNSIVQCISNTNELRNYFCEGSYRDDVNTNTKTRGQIVEELALVVRALWANEYRTIACRDFKRAAGSYHVDFGGVRQQDSHEFLTLLMDWLHNDLNKKHHIKQRIPPAQEPEEPPQQIEDMEESAKIAWHDFEKCNDSRILHLFFGQQSSTVRCNSCSFESVTFEPFSTLTLVLPQNSDKCSLNDCLNLYLAPEPIQEWRCPKCKLTRRATKKFDIWRLPPILVIHFKRFCEDIAWRKQHTLVEFPLQRLTMTQYTVRPNQKHTFYDLYAVSNHYGTMEGGHYTTYSRSATFKKWYKFDDADVSEISESSVRSNAAYILFYASQNLRSSTYILPRDR
ncbi:ubiquitin carboxyl-terminal hydrolase 8 [Cloeon dipterum]|uniref:ubiquitin carboxyl-terminal hydrolase 8 n=1 Tax=Cloeon dipterum TaxID=197152 RepID=UPI0032202AD9